MSDTPRTDAALVDAPIRIDPRCRLELVNASFARTLERELVAANYALHAIADILEPHWKGAGAELGGPWMVGRLGELIDLIKD